MERGIQNQTVDTTLTLRFGDVSLFRSKCDLIIVVTLMNKEADTTTELGDTDGSP